MPRVVEDAFELRTMLEAHAARRAAQRMDEGRLLKLRACNAALYSAIDRDRPDVPAFLDHNRAATRNFVVAANSCHREHDFELCDDCCSHSSY